MSRRLQAYGLVCRQRNSGTIVKNWRPTSMGAKPPLAWGHAMRAPTVTPWRHCRAPRPLPRVVVGVVEWCRHLNATTLGAAGCALLLILSGCQSKPKIVPTPVPSPPVTPPNPVAPIPASGTPSHMRGTIFFLKGDERLSPGALNRLKTWTTAWGADGTWVLAYPSNPEISVDLMGKRILVLRTELQKLGVSKIDTKILPNEPPGQYDAIHVEK